MVGGGGKEFEPMAIPDELRRIPQWLLWRKEKSGGKPGKVPYRPDGRRASTTKPTDRFTFSTVINTLGKGYYTGVGFVFTAEDPYVGIDLDNCIDECGHVAPEAQAIIDALDSYTEVSPSGRGVKIWVKGQLPWDGKRTKKVDGFEAIECYQSGRYFTVTGNLLSGTRGEIRKAQRELDAIVNRYFADKEASKPQSPAKSTTSINAGFRGTDEALLQAIRRSKSGARFGELYDEGNLSDHGEDESVADFALVGILAFWCGPDPERIDRLFRGSMLYREKWNFKRGQSTYGAQTIQKILANTTEYYTPPKPLPKVDSDAEPEYDSLEELGQSVDELLNDPKAGGSRSRKRRISTAVCRWFLKKSRLLCDLSTGTPAPYVVADDNSVLALDDSLVVQILLSRACLNATETMYRWILADLRTTAVKQGPRICLCRYAQRSNKSIYLSSGPTDIVKVTATGMQLVPNGMDDIWFTGEHTYPAWKPSKPVSPVDVPLLCPILEAPPEVPAYTEAVQTRVLHVWLVAVVVGIRPLPAALCIGQMGTGKTLTSRGMGIIPNGPEANVTTMPTTLRDMQVILTGSPLVAFDNADAETEPWFPDLFATAVTGGNVEVRKLYTTAESFTAPINAALCLSARTPHFAERADIQERLLPFFFGERRDQDRRDDSALLAEVQQKRDGLMSWIALTAAVLLRESSSESYPGRFQLFGRLVCALDPFTGAESLEVAYRAARASVVDLHPLIKAVIEFGKPLSGNTSDITKKLEENGYLIPYLGGGKKIANLLREHKHLYRLFEYKNYKGVDFQISPLQNPGESRESGESGISSLLPAPPAAKAD
jgi:hypothetical protein